MVEQTSVSKVTVLVSDRQRKPSINTVGCVGIHRDPRKFLNS